MEDHIKLMAWVAKLVHPFIVVGGQGTVMNLEFIWQSGRDRLIEFLQAATCADELEDLWRRMEDDDEEVDPLGCVLEISGHDESVLNPRSNETPIVPAGINVEMSEEEAAGKAPEISPEEEAADSSSRLSATRLFLQRIYSRLWEPTLQDRQTGKIFDSTKGYPGEGPISGGPDLPTNGMPWIPEDHLDMVVAKKVDQSSDQGEEGCFGLESGSQPEPVVVEATATEKSLGLFGGKGIEPGIGGCVVRMYLDPKLEQ